MITCSRQDGTAPSTRQATTPGVHVRHDETQLTKLMRPGAAALRGREALFHAPHRCTSATALSRSEEAAVCRRPCSCSCSYV